MIILCIHLLLFDSFRHILEHLNGVIDKPEVEMSDEELQFHYFKLHDYDQNTKLDGIEIIDAMTHYHKGKHWKQKWSIYTPGHFICIISISFIDKITFSLF